MTKDVSALLVPLQTPLEGGSAGELPTVWDLPGPGTIL